MSGRAVNRTLFAAVPVLVLTGLLSWGLPEAGAALLVMHRAAGAALLVLLAWKLGIARRSISLRSATGRTRTVFVGAVTSAALLVTLGLGLAWTIGLVSFDRPLGYSLLNVHVFVGVALVPLVVAHSAQRWEHTRRGPAGGRRDALRLIGVGGAGVVAAALLDRVDPARRWTGSRAAASYSGNAFPTTIWTFDTVPSAAVGQWRLSVTGAVAAERAVTYDELLAMPSVERDAVLDCTGGWWSAQRWRGVPLATLVVPKLPASRVRITSVTGHSATFPLDRSGALLLATHVGDERLAPEHGYPVRLVAPGRRGFDWVKWVQRIEVF